MPSKALVRNFNGQPAVMSVMDDGKTATANGSVMVSVFGQDLRSVMSQADWEKLPPWTGPLPSGFKLDEED